MFSVERYGPELLPKLPLIAAVDAPSDNKQKNTVPAVTAWIQWTVAKVSATLYADQSMLVKAEMKDSQLQPESHTKDATSLNITTTDNPVCGATSEIVPSPSTSNQSMSSFSKCLPLPSVKVESRLRVELEDLTMAIDLQQIYTKIKCRVAAFNAMHSIFQ